MKAAAAKGGRSDWAEKKAKRCSSVISAIIFLFSKVVKLDVVFILYTYIYILLYDVRRLIIYLRILYKLYIFDNLRQKLLRT